MDFIESVFGISPDGGSGMAELLILLVPFVVTAILTARRHRVSQLHDLFQARLGQGQVLR